MNNQLYIPEKLNIGYTKRSDTYDDTIIPIGRFLSVKNSQTASIASLAKMEDKLKKFKERLDAVLSPEMKRQIEAIAAEMELDLN